MGRTANQNNGVGGIHSGNSPSPSITNKIGANGPPKTGTNVLQKAANKQATTSMGDDDANSDSPTTATTQNTGTTTTGTSGTKSAQDMQNSPEAVLDVINGEDVPEITATDMKVNIQPGSKNIELVSKDKKTKIELPQEDFLARMQELSGIQQ